MLSDYQRLFAHGRRAGHNPHQIAAAWRAANIAHHGTEDSPERMARTTKSKLIGAQLRAGKPFREALQVAGASPRAETRWVERRRGGIEARNPAPDLGSAPILGRKAIVFAAAGLALYLFHRKNPQAASAMTGAAVVASAL